MEHSASLVGRLCRVLLTNWVCVCVPAQIRAPNTDRKATTTHNSHRAFIGIEYRVSAVRVCEWLVRVSFTPAVYGGPSPPPPFAWLYGGEKHQTRTMQTAQPG